MSEWCHMQGGRDKTMNSALIMADVVYNDINILNVSSWQHWIAVSEVDYCDGLIYINLSDRTFEMTKRYYVTGNFSKYIPFGAEKIGVSCPDKELKILAFTKEGKTVSVVINDTDKEKTVSFLDFSEKVKLVLTDEAHDLEETESDSKNIIIPKKSVVTIINEK